MAVLLLTSSLIWLTADRGVALQIGN